MDNPTPEYVLSHLLTSDYLGIAHKREVLKVLLDSPDLQDDVKKLLNQKNF